MEISGQTPNPVTEQAMRHRGVQMSRDHTAVEDAPVALKRRIGPEFG